MSYATYTTEALVCGAFDRNTADRTYLLYTREAGMLYAEAKSVREERSKQRYALQEFSYIRVSLVKGKQAWKTGSVEVIENDYQAAKSREARGSVALIYRTLRRFIHGEDASAELFDFCLKALRHVEGAEVSKREFVDSYIQVMIMQHLGYVSASSIPRELADLTVENVETAYSELLQTNLTVLYNQATKESHL